MRIGLYIGFGLLGLAFLAATAELAAQAQTRTFGIMSFHTVLQTIFPGDLTILKIRIERNLSPFIWDPLIVSVLALPGWAIFGVPGALIAWRYRKRAALTIDEQDNAPYSSYEDIVAAAEEADEEAGEEDDFPSKYRNYDEFDPASASDEASLTRYMEEWDPADRMPDEAADQPGFLPPTGRPAPDAEEPDEENTA